jgi:hypothetical protein
LNFELIYSFMLDIWQILFHCLNNRFGVTVPAFTVQTEVTGGGSMFSGYPATVTWHSHSAPALSCHEGGFRGYLSPRFQAHHFFSTRCRLTCPALNLFSAKTNRTSIRALARPTVACEGNYAASHLRLSPSW